MFTSISTGFHITTPRFPLSVNQRTLGWTMMVPTPPFVKSLCIHVINSELRFGEQALKRYIELRPKGCENGWIWLDSSSGPFNHELTNFIWFFKVLKHPNQLKPPKSSKSLIKTPHGSAHKWTKKTRGGLRTQKQNDSKQIWVILIIGLFLFRLLPASF